MRAIVCALKRSEGKISNTDNTGEKINHMA